jgi:Peptidase family M1 domain
MKFRRCLLLGLSGTALLSAGAQTPMFPRPLSPRIASYRIAVTLDASEKSLSGRETLTWRNTSNDVIGELQFHLYLNAFKNEQSTFMRDRKWGGITVTSMKTADGADLTGRMAFIHPDDENGDDQTVVRVPLVKPVPPKQSISLVIDFTARLPGIFARTGYYRDFFMVGQWFPKIGVYEEAGQRFATRGGWNCHQFHSTTEFFADFGVYDVDITVSEPYIVGATGVLQSEKRNADGTKTASFHAEDVHDFAWTASPRYADLRDTWRNVSIRVLMQPQRTGLADRYFQSAKAALEYFDSHVGPYPYPVLTIVDPAYGALGAAGMEYPTLITAGSFWGIGASVKLQEEVTVHEFGHQYWYGMSASNEFEEAWLDEGVNQYYETRIMTEAYGTKTSMLNWLGLRVGDEELTRSSYAAMSNPRIAPTATEAWKFPRNSYGNLTYNKTAVFLTTLERMIGRPAMDSTMKTFFRQWQFKHPCARDFIAAFNEIVPRMTKERYGKDLNWYFDQVLYGTGVCDYELTSIQNEPADTHSEPGEKADSAALSEDVKRDRARTFSSTVTVSRLGEIMLPVTVGVIFDDGSDATEQWDGRGRTVSFRYERAARVTRAIVDPDHILTIDIDYTNNSRTISPPASPIWKYTAKVLFWLQNAFALFATIG